MYVCVKTAMCCVNMLHPLLYTSVTESSSAQLRSRFSNPTPFHIPPHPLLLFSLLPRLPPSYLLLQRLQLPHALPPISESSLSYITTPSSHKPPASACACTPAITETVRSSDVKLSALFLSSSLPSSLSLSLALVGLNTP